jgi:hypothetical protein
MPSEPTRGIGAPDEILTYEYIKPQNQWFLTEGPPPDQPHQDRPGAQGIYPLGMLACSLRRRNLTEPRHDAAPAQGSGARPGLRLPIDDTFKLELWILPGLRH